MPGTRFYNCDFHIHTPVSTCYKDKTISVELIVDKAIERNIDVIAITDHNTYTGIENVQKSAMGKPLVIFPGVEITAEGGHILAVFEPSIDISIIDDLLTTCGITKDKRGKENALGKPFFDVVNFITQDFGGVAIAAHADGPKGFLTTIGQGQLRIKNFMNQNLSAIELVDISHQENYLSGKDPNYCRKMPCIQNSDSHSLDEIGSRITRIKMQDPTILGLKHAFIDPTLRIKFPSTWQENSYPVIKSLSVDKGFLSGQIFDFNNGLNCLLGGAGSGKSTIIEFLRFTFDQVSEVEEIRKDCYGKIKDLAGLGAVIRVEFINSNNDEMILERTYDEIENQITLYRKEDYSILQDVNIKEYFPISAYSQGEAIIIAKNPLAQLELIDNHINIQNELVEINDCYKNLDADIEPILSLQLKVDEKSTNKKELSTNQEKIKGLNKELEQITTIIKDPIFKSHQSWKVEEDFINTYKSYLKETKTQINDLFKNLDFPIFNIDKIEEKTPNKNIMDGILAYNKELKTSFPIAKKIITSTLQEIEQKFQTVETTWGNLFSDHELAYKKISSKTDEKRIEEINNELSALRRKNKKLQEKKHEIESAELQLQALFDIRKRKLEKLKYLRNTVFTKRKLYIKSINSLIPELRIIISPDMNFSGYKELIQEALKGTRARQQLIEFICENISPKTLSTLINNKNYQKLGELIDDRDWNEKIINQFNLKKEFLYRLESLPIEDLLDIQFKVDEKTYKPIEKLSTGQKATVIVILSMLEGKSPIVFDQPEDALYTPFIYSNIVKTIRNSKENRQFLFATHNPNIAVASDLDLGIILESTSSTTSIQTSGSLDNYNTNKLIVLHLEGGKDAIKKRIDQYELDK